jgi:hypothetical protein
MLKQLLASSLVLTLAAAGLPPCVGMDMSVGAMAEHHCCEADSCPDVVDNGPRHGSSIPQADCCVFASVPAERAPAQRTTAEAGARLLSVAMAAPAAWTAPFFEPILPPTSGPPGSPGISRHLLLSVLLI